MRANPLTPAMRTARFLNIALNFVMFVLVIALLAMLILPFFAESVIEAIEDKNGNAPSLPAINASYAFGGSIIAAAYLYVAFVVKKIVKTTINGDPFVSENISRLRTTWVVIAFVEIARTIFTALLGHDININLTAWFLVFIVAIMAEVFRIGLELKRDQEFTV